MCSGESSHPLIRIKSTTIMNAARFVAILVAPHHWPVTFRPNSSSQTVEVTSWMPTPRKGNKRHTHGGPTAQLAGQSASTPINVAVGVGTGTVMRTWTLVSGDATRHHSLRQPRDQLIVRQWGMDCTIDRAHPLSPQRCMNVGWPLIKRQRWGWFIHELIQPDWMWAFDS